MATSGATCNYCSELFTDPRMLPCLHSFCAQCLAKVSEIKGAKEALQCPTCNEKAPLQESGVNAFPKNLRKMYEAEVAQCSLKVKGGKENCDDCGRSVAVAFCVNCCEFLCKSCDDHHRLSRKTKKHKILATGEMGKENEESVLSNYPEQPMHCSVHTDEVMKVYCEKCDELICRDCMEFEHNDHRSQCNRVERIAAKAMESLKMSLESSDEAIATLDNSIALCKKVCQKVETRKKEVDNMITRSLNQVREALLAKNEEIRLRKITGLEMQMSELKRVRDGLSLASDMITATQSHTPAQQLSTKKVMAERAALLLQQFRGSDLTPLESDGFLTKVAEPTTISQMISLGQISGGSHAASSTCDVGYMPRAVVGKERTIKVTARDEEGELFPNGGEVVEAKLSLMGSQEPVIRGKTSDHGDGTYSVSFTAQSAGEHELQVTIASRHIRGSPFTVTARHPRTTPYTSLACQKSISTYQYPWDVAVTEDGCLAVVEYGYHTVSLYSVNGQRQFTFGIGNGSIGSADGQFYYPSSVAIKGDEMYVSENHNHRVQKFSISKQSFISKFGSSGSGDGQFSSPRGICIDPVGKVYVADWSNHRIQVFQADGTFAYSITADPNNSDSQFQNPWGLAFDPQGRLHIAAYSSHCIKVFTPEGAYIESYGSGTIYYPAGIAIDEEGYTAITEYGSNHRLLMYSPTHTQLLKTLQDSTYPAGVVCDAEGMFWVAAQNNNLVRGY